MARISSVSPSRIAAGAVPARTASARTEDEDEDPRGEATLFGQLQDVAPGRDEKLDAGSWSGGAEELGQRLDLSKRRMRCADGDCPERQISLCARQLCPGRAQLGEVDDFGGLWRLVT